MDESLTKTTVSSSTSRIWKIAVILLLSTTVIFISLFIWSEHKEDTNYGNQGLMGTSCGNYSCNNGGTCFLDDAQPKCACMNGFTGDNCTTTPCVSYSCDNGGTCFLDGLQPKCACDIGFTGENCTVTPCSQSPCEHSGNCSVTGNSFSCTCLNGFTGLQCQSTPCLSYSCYNGGTCFLEEFQPKCACKNGFTGQNCEDTPCVNYFCDNGGTCFLDEFQPKCACENGFTGQNCEVTPCSGSPCEHSGNCSVTGSSFSCTCLNGFTGLQCQNTPCVNHFCDNGGTCFLDELQPKCACENGFTGQNCEVYQADFENNMGSIFIQDLNDDKNWTIQEQNSTPSSGTGPSSAYKGDFYLFIETSKGSEGDIARLLSRDFMFEYSGCLKFQHHMYGATMGTLNVYQGSSLIWNKTGDHGNQWHLAEISLQANSFSSSKISFEAVQGSSYTSDIAIDDVQVLLTDC
ncbi:Neurogenic locus notch homolog protein 2 [Mytilus edulis]|uniref:Neurogenic locus notch homolog protein 2 n=1 Tax=Mytilus edulis TaxID=6550 RepID=A0A8S3UVB4_MYTED|nr:Neurogenic locus notch homolog protein 2 [Mytilus edulis]